MGGGVVEKTAKELREEILLSYCRQPKITERLYNPSTLRRGGSSVPPPPGFTVDGGRHRGFVRTAERIELEDQSAPKRRRHSTAVVKDEDTERNQGTTLEASVWRDDNQRPAEMDNSDDWSGINSVGCTRTGGHPVRYTAMRQGYPNAVLLREEETHLSTFVRSGDLIFDYRPLRGGMKDIISIWGKCPNCVRALVKQAGFTHFLNALIETQRSTMLMSALAEHWWDTTNTFHMPIGEMTMTPLDFYMITGLSVGGTPIAFDRGRTLTDEAVTVALGIMPPLSTGFTVRSTWLRDRLQSWQFDEEDGRQVRQYTRMLLLYTIGHTILASSGDTIHLWILPFLIRFNKIANYDWGGLALATLYKSMSTFSRMAQRSHLGFGFAWEVWAYEVLGINLLMLRDPMVDAWPRMRRWGGSNRVRYSDGESIRSALNSLTKDQVRWRPWENWRDRWGVSGERTAQRVLLRGEYSSVFYLGERVIRQFLDVDVLHPPLPPPPHMRCTDQLTDDEVLAFELGTPFDKFLDTKTSYADFQATYLMPLLLRGGKGIAAWAPPPPPPPPPPSSPPSPPPPSPPSQHSPCSTTPSSSTEPSTPTCVFQPTLPDYSIMYYDDLGIPRYETYPRLSGAAEMLPLPAEVQAQEFVSVPRSFLEEVAIHLGSVRAFCRVQLKRAQSHDVASHVEPMRAPLTAGEEQALPIASKRDNGYMRK